MIFICGSISLRNISYLNGGGEGSIVFVHRKGTETCSCCVLTWHLCRSVYHKGLYQSCQMGFFVDRML